MSNVWIPWIALTLLFHDGVHERLDAAQRRIAARPLDARPWLEHARLAREHGDPVRALSDLEVAERLDECVDGIDRERGLTCAALGAHADAVGAFERAVERAPNDAAAHRGLAGALAELGEARRAFEERALAVRWTREDEPDLFLELAQDALRLTGAGESPARAAECALGALEFGIKRTGGAAALHLRAVEIEEQRGRIDAALARLEAWGRTLERRELAWLARAQLCERAGRRADAERNYRAALELLARRPEREQAAFATRELVRRGREGLARTAGSIHAGVAGPSLGEVGPPR